MFYYLRNYNKSNHVFFNEDLKDFENLLFFYNLFPLIIILYVLKKFIYYMG